MTIYNELFFNNVESFLSNSFPVLRSILSKDRWLCMVRDFFARHVCRTPLFTRLAEEFLTYLEEERDSVAEEPPFLLELAHYEWLELALTLADADDDHSSIDPNGNLLAGHPVVSPLAWRLTYAYAVHRISPAYIPEAAEQTPVHLVVYRDRQDRIGFLEANSFIHALLERLDTEQMLTGAAALNAIILELNPVDPQRVRLSGYEMLREFRRRDILLGTAR